MATLRVGPTQLFHSIAEAMVAAVANDTIQLDSGYSNETATVSFTGMTFNGDATSTGIVLQLGVGIAVFTLTGAAPFTVLDGSGGNGIVGNAGDNMITVSSGIDAVDGGAGIDQLIVDYRLATGAVTGDSTSNFTEAGGGGRSVTVTDGTIEHFTVLTGPGADTLTTGAGNDVINAGNGANTITAGQGANSVTGGNDADTITTGSGSDTILSGTGADTIVAGAGNDFITVRGGADDVKAGPGTDLLTVDYSATITNVSGGITGGDFAGGYVGHLADLVAATVDFAGVENFSVTTGSGNDSITTGDGNDSLSGGAGNDTLVGGLGNDSIRGGSGNDSLDGGGGSDSLTYSGHLSDYTITDNLDGTTTIIDNRVGSPEGTDIVRGFEFTLFNNGPTGSVTITGTPTSGETLTAANTLADADGIGTVTYQWQAGGSPILGATGTTFVLTPAQIGLTITVVGSYTDLLGSPESSTSAPTAAVGADITPPTALATVLALSADTGISATDFITTVAAQTVSGSFTGTLLSGESIQVSADGGTTWVSATTAGATWSAAGVTLVDGIGTLAVRSVDALSNAAAGTGHGYTLDTTSPTAAAVTATPADAVLGVGAVVSMALTMSQAVLIDTTGGTPRLVLNNGGFATYVSGSGTDTLTFSYTVPGGQPTTDLTVTGVNLSGGTMRDTAGNSASLGEAAFNPTGILRIERIAGFDTTTNTALGIVGHAYTGPVLGITSEFVTVTPDSLNIAVVSPNWFIHTGGGDDAISVASGTNVLDGGTGSNFLSGGTGQDTFFVDHRGTVADTWSTIANFQTGDAATIWGVRPSDFTFTYLTGHGAVGYTGLTLHASAAGQPTASLTFVGFDSLDLINGRLVVTSGIEAVSGNTYTHFVCATNVLL